MSSSDMLKARNYKYYRYGRYGQNLIFTASIASIGTLILLCNHYNVSFDDFHQSSDHSGLLKKINTYRYNISKNSISRDKIQSKLNKDRKDKKRFNFSKGTNDFLHEKWEMGALDEIIDYFDDYFDDKMVCFGSEN